MAAESAQTFLLLAVLALNIFADPCEGQELRCQCIQTHSDFISPKFIKHIQLIPEGAHCSRKEIIATLEDGKLICLDPEAKWVMIIIKKIVTRLYMKKVLLIPLPSVMALAQARMAQALIGAVTESRSIQKPIRIQTTLLGKLALVTSKVTLVQNTHLTYFEKFFEEFEG